MGLLFFKEVREHEAGMKSIHKGTHDPWFVALIGLLLVVFSVLGMWRSITAGIAQTCYYRAKYGAARLDIPEALQLCRKAYQLYPHNYYFSILAAETAYWAAEQPKADRKRWLREASLWCDRGLRQNARKSQLRRLHARLLWLESPRKAIRSWAEYTEWNFWEPYNHAVLAGMYAKAGDFEKAEAELMWTTGTAEAESARREVEQERQAWEEALGGSSL